MTARLPRWRPWLALALYAGVMAYLSSQSHPLPELTAHVWDKVLHVTEYGGFGALLSFGLRRRGLSGRDLVFWAALAGFLWGAGDEFHQSFVPWRSADVGDLIADCLGSSLGGLAVALVSLRAAGPSGAGGPARGGPAAPAPPVSDGDAASCVRRRRAV